MPLPIELGPLTNHEIARLAAEIGGHAEVYPAVAAAWLRRYSREDQQRILAAMKVPQQRRVRHPTWSL
jgi:hypothetical protein